MTKHKKSSKTSGDSNVVQFFPKATAVAVGNAFNSRPRPMEVKHGKQANQKQTWEALAAIGDEIAGFIAQMANDINESVELVKRVGCDHIAEFNAVVLKTNKDFETFLGDFEKIKAKHSGKTGYIDGPDDLALSLSIFEDYNQFNAYFNGVMHHTLISFTEYALEAQDRLRQQAAAEEQKEEKNEQ